MSDKKRTGSKSEFDRNWQQRPEAKYNHWTAGRPRNQVQLAFRRHWQVFKMIVGESRGRCLEIGCGRGSVSSYFADNGFDCTLLDYSYSVVTTAREIFQTNNHAASFVCGDAMDLPFPDETFDVCVSIGLLEHFEDVETPMAQQVRVLRPGGVMLAYIVPEANPGVQKRWNWVNDALKEIFRIAGREEMKAPPKEDIFRSNFDSKYYLKYLKNMPVDIELVSGMYSLPMVSHSPEFPFSLLPEEMELALVEIFEIMLRAKPTLHKDPWLCPEKDAQAFLIVAKKT